MTVFGITGGSGSGKTTASAMLSELGVHVIDADVIAREITCKGSKCLDELTEYFGTDILNSDGSLNRKALASKAFSDKEKTSALNRITHKFIKERVIDDINHSKADITAIDGAVIIGSNIEPLCAFIVSVAADADIRLERIKKRDGLSDEQAARRLSAQPDDDFYRRHSRYALRNNGDADDLKNQINILYNEIKRGISIE